MAPSALSMSQIIASDAPLLSPVSSESSWGQHYSPTAASFDASFAYSYPMSVPPSPPVSMDSPLPPQNVLKKSRYASPDSVDGSEVCVATHQVFDFSPEQHMYTQPSTPYDAQSETCSPPPQSRPTAAKRGPSEQPSSEPKKRASASRVSVKDFVPPDVSGLSKREARLVKNRAAAFLSRQRKREEFENMEVRVAELEQENARLLAIANGSAPPASSSDATSLLSEIETLRAKLAESERREQELASKLSTSVKSESQSTFIKPEPRSPSLHHRSASSGGTSASIGLVVLLCALPTLLGLPAHHHQSHSSLPTTYPFPAFSPSGEYLTFSDYGSSGSMPGDFEYQLSWRDPSTGMNVDLDSPSLSAPGKLEFPVQGPNGAGALDVSFESVPSSDGKIRVRINPSAGASSTGQTLSVDSSSFSSAPSSSLVPFSNDLHSNVFLSPDSDMLGSSSFGMGMDMESPLHLMDGDSGLGGLGLSAGMGLGAASAGKKKRVRITLMSGGEGGQGEWEVEVC
ncbi:hypothetical protein GLOTRDRAFT_138787 [Gloeophyllum trabeum ATCC 11539]|uniref:BZIP domain-containing protein n=1 Tax=Gloeophyllum trabeum (strain ATCC 11539 / FP-39264 / Madison 617) TaxID=670483 RepID=S7RL72_GLOTA|nr:uncharacterized protein GLOTRDRAFT_138787 [Gloeophyllum trabeum ATCC 11539]EPQ55125.1 hypothetical protein GLOTRDRAFT_138787 [Gloeophyllum trabeum ATCC 11539]